MAAGVLILTVWALFRLKSSRSKRHTKRLVGPTAFATATGKRPLPLSQPGGQKSDPGPTGVQDPAVLRTTLQAVMVDAQEVTRLCAAQIENRAAMLDRLIADADHKIAQLDALLEATRQQQRTPGPMSDTQYRPPAVATHTQPEPVPTDQVHVRPLHDPLTQRVMQMASQGHSPLHIASTLNEQVGKVNLILALHSPAPTARTASG